MDLKEENHAIAILNNEFPGEKFVIRSYYLKSNKKNDHGTIEVASAAIAKKITAFRPDTVVTYGDEALEHIALKQFGGNPKVKIFFYCLSEWVYKRIGKLPDNVYGTVNELSYDKVAASLKTAGMNNKNVYILSDGAADSVEALDYLKTVTFASADVEIITVSTYEQLKKAMFDLAGKKQGILVMLARSISSSAGNIAGRYLYEEVSELNKKHFELAIGKNATVWGFGSSLSCPHSLNECPAADLFTLFVKDAPVKDKVVRVKNVFSVNHQRLDKMGMSDFMNSDVTFDHVLDL